MTTPSSEPGQQSPKFSDEEIEQILQSGERLYEPVEIAHALSITQKTAQEWCRTGRLKAFKVGVSWRVPLREMKRYLKEGLLKGE